MAYSCNTLYCIKRVFYRIVQIGPYYTIATFVVFAVLGPFKAISAPTTAFQ